MNDNTRDELIGMVKCLCANLELFEFEDLYATASAQLPLACAEAAARIANELRGLTTEQHELNARWDMAYLKWQRHKEQYYQETGIRAFDDECATGTGIGWLHFVDYFPHFATGTRRANPPLEHVEAFERYVARLEPDGAE